VTDLYFAALRRLGNARTLTLRPAGPADHARWLGCFFSATAHPGPVLGLTLISLAVVVVAFSNHRPRGALHRLPVPSRMVLLLGLTALLCRAAVVPCSPSALVAAAI